MLSVRWEPNKTKVSLHRIFLEAPFDVRLALASYLRGEQKSLSTKIKAFIETRSQAGSLSRNRRMEKLESCGSVYDLKEIYGRLNRIYFQSCLRLAITWFGNSKPQSRSRCSLGLYYDLRKLVKIHRLLDDASVPEYVVEYVIYHEMLHSVCPAFVDERGGVRAHTQEFKIQEKLFMQYDAAVAWIKQYQMKFFAPSRTYIYGRTQQMGKYQAPKKQGRCQERKALFQGV
jgi:hypothetical protein